MLNIELIRFEAQDVITASVATPNEYTGPECKCNHGPTAPYHGYWTGGAFQRGQFVRCEAHEGHHDGICNRQ